MAVQKCKTILLQAALKDFWSSTNLKQKIKFFKNSIFLKIILYINKNARIGVLGSYFCWQVI